VLIALVAAGMAAQAVSFLHAADVVHVLGQRVWDTSGILSEKSLVGRLLHTLIGYTDQPTALQLVAYLGTLAVMGVLTWVATPARRPAGAAA
jgi:high-affinity iron transporter